jgi:hypothetical protein
MLAAAMVVAVPTAALEVFPEASLDKINLFRQMDLTTGQQMTTAQWVEQSTYGWSQYGAPYAIDGGRFNAQYMFNSAGHDPADYANNAVSLRFTMSSPQPIGMLTQDLNPGAMPHQYRVKVSNDLAGEWTILTGEGGSINDGWVTGTAMPSTYIGAAYTYIQIDYLGTTGANLNIRQVVASPMENAVISTTAGYNLLALHNLPGGTGMVTEKSGWAFRADNPNAIFGTYNGALIQSNDHGQDWGRPGEDRTNVENYFVLPLNDLYTLVGFATGAEHGQAWTGITIWYTDEDITADDWDEANWKLAYTRNTSLSSSFDMILFTSGPVEARYVRVGAPNNPGQGSENQLTGFELYAMNPIPEPATMALLALGGLAMLRRRA